MQGTTPLLLDRFGEDGRSKLREERGHHVFAVGFGFALQHVLCFGIVLTWRDQRNSAPFMVIFLVTVRSSGGAAES